jgi:ABC-2 type transport system ATP-binding protein
MIQTLNKPSDTARASEQVAIKCVALTKTFRDFWMRSRVTAVNELDLEVHSGELFGLLGPNGSGKSTTIKMILGLLKPTSGGIAVLGKRAKDVNSKKQVGYLPEESYLYPFLTAREILDYYGRLLDIDRAQRRKRTDMLLDMVGLDAVQHRPIGEYSKGMQRRIGLAQALINDPKLLILDEPTAGMDPVGTRQIKDLLLHLREHGKTILLCSHLLGDVEDVCDRVGIMYGGKLRSLGTCDELLVQEQLSNIRTGVLTDAAIAEIRALLARHQISLEAIEQPRQRLESLFMQIVELARAEGVATHGAKSGGSIAAFLGEGTASPVDVVNELVANATVARDDAERQHVDEMPITGNAAPRPQAPDIIEHLVKGLQKASPSSAPTNPAKAKPAVDKSMIDRLVVERPGTTTDQDTTTTR